MLAVDRLDELTDLIATLSWQPLPTGPRVAVISNAGGAGVLAADGCVAAGLQVPPLSEPAQRELARILPSTAEVANPVDTTAVVPARTFAAAAAVLLAAPDVDAVIALTVPTALGDPFPGIARAAAAHPAKRRGRPPAWTASMRLAPAGPELLVGIAGDPVFGPLVVVGLGGTATDLSADRAHRLVPLSEADADDLLDAFRAGKRLFDPQQGPRPDRAAVRDVIVRVAALAEHLPEVVELDLNPVIAGTDRCVAVDARIRVSPPPRDDPALRALRV